MKQDLVDKLRALMLDGKLGETEHLIVQALQETPKDDALHYWMGNLRRQQNNWKEALEHYAEAIELNPNSEANEARAMLIDIISFYDKERYNV